MLSHLDAVRRLHSRSAMLRDLAYNTPKIGDVYTKTLSRELAHAAAWLEHFLPKPEADTSSPYSVAEIDAPRERHPHPPA